MARIIYEDKNFLAFLDIAPFVEGHTQVIPKKHYRWVWDLPAGRQGVPNIGQYFAVVKKIANHYQQITDDKWIASIIWGTLVNHAHIQILPSPYNLDLTWVRSKFSQRKALKIQKKYSLLNQNGKRKKF